MVKSNYISAVGRRKRAVARVRLMKSKEPILINGIAAISYFPGEVNQEILQEPLVLAGLADKYSATIKVNGSGQTSQLLAAVHGLARTIVKLEETLKPKLKAGGLLTRDSRKRQRRQVGTGGKSRRKKQSPKR